MTYFRRYLTKGRHHKRNNLSYYTIAGLLLLILAGWVANTTTGSASSQETVTAVEQAEYLETRATEQYRANRQVRPRVGKVAPPNIATKAAPAPAPTVTKPVPPKPRPASWVKPVRSYSFTSTFGSRWGTLHAGVDLAAPTGTPVYAAHSGTISLARWYGGYGYAVKINHGNGFTTLYGHNSKLLVSPGQRVSAGQRISLMGSTGDSTGPHLHFETHVNGSPVDPVPFMAKRGVNLR